MQNGNQSLVLQLLFFFSFLVETIFGWANKSYITKKKVKRANLLESKKLPASTLFCASKNVPHANAIEFCQHRQNLYSFPDVGISQALFLKATHRWEKQKESMINWKILLGKSNPKKCSARYLPYKLRLSRCSAVDVKCESVTAFLRA